MTRATLVVVPLAVVVAGALGLVLSPGPAVAWTAVLALATPWFLWRRQRRRVGTLARDVNSWLGPSEHEPLTLEGGVAWRELASTLNAVGATLDRRNEALAAQPEWRTHVVGSIDGPALIFSDADRLVAANDAARSLLGLPDDDGDLTVVQALGTGAMAGAVRECREGGRPVVVDAEERGRHLRITASAVGDDVLVIVTDRTEQRRVEEIRRNFVVNASHELKTPATAIQTLSEALEVAIDGGSERVPDLLSQLREESERLIRMVHDLLDLRRLEERGPFEAAPVDLAALVREVLADHHARAEARDVRIDAELPDRAMIAGVAHDLRLVIANLVANAIQYNRAGGAVEVELRPGGAGWYELAVRDTGVGIPRHSLHRVFERFYRVDTARSRELGGTGLGLAIVRHAVERHGGSVAVDSLLGEGTAFTVRLPVEPA